MIVDSKVKLGAASLRLWKHRGSCGGGSFDPFSFPAGVPSLVKSLFVWVWLHRKVSLWICLLSLPRGRVGNVGLEGCIRGDAAAIYKHTCIPASPPPRQSLKTTHASSYRFPGEEKKVSCSCRVGGLVVQVPKECSG